MPTSHVSPSYDRISPSAPIDVRTAPPALVLGNGITALGVVRALGRAGIPLHAVSVDPGFVRASRWYQGPPGGAALDDVAQLADYLRAIPLEGGVLVPTSDHAVLAVARLPRDLQERFPSSQAPLEVVERLLDKERLRGLLAALDVPHPRTVGVDRPDDLDALDGIDLDHCFIKPRDSQRFSRLLGVKALRPSSRNEMRLLLDRLAREGHPVVLQEYVPGPPTHHHFLDGFVDRDGRVRACLARRRLRASTPDFGNSSATVSVPLEDVRPAAADLMRILETVGYRGPFNAEFKLDEGDGTFRLLEINVRPWWQVEFAAMCGIDVVTMLYRDALGLLVADVEDYAVGVEWILAFTDLAACVRLARTGDMTWREVARSRLSARWVEFAPDDPLPGFARGVEVLWRSSRPATGAFGRARR